MSPNIPEDPSRGDSTIGKTDGAGDDTNGTVTEPSSFDATAPPPQPQPPQQQPPNVEPALASEPQQPLPLPSAGGTPHSYQPEWSTAPAPLPHQHGGFSRSEPAGASSYAPAGLFGAAPQSDSGAGLGPVPIQLPDGVEQHPKTGRGRRIAAVAALVAVLTGGSGLLGGVVGANITHDARGGPITTHVAGATANAKETANTSIISQAKQSTVSIDAGDQTGSGIIVSDDGYILTNNHVIADASGRAVQVTLNSGDKVNATIVKTDASQDLALLKATGSYQAATLGSSGNLKEGQQVYAIGSPYGLNGSVSEGIISATHRQVSTGEGQQTPQDQQRSGRDFLGQYSQQTASDSGTLSNVLQTDAAINPGSSGGPLINANGEVVGVNAAIAANGGGGNVGIGFAIPIDTAKKFIASADTGH